MMVRRIQRSTDPEEVKRIVADALPEEILGGMGADDFARIDAHVKQAPEPSDRIRLTRENWRGAFGVFLLVFLSTFPVVVPFMFMHDARLALRISNAVAIVMLFASGWILARYAGLRPMVTGVAMVGIGAALVAITIALGG
jgi:VIT1/CCC1 family predicted Fe2+/Mn2+ transporter